MSQAVQKKVVDSRGSFCPGPLTDLFKAYRSASPGDLIEVWATDPAAKSDITAWASKTGNQLVSVEDDEGYTRITVKVTNKKA
ncbi:MAG: sulfurtransferase TusA family protein [Nitrososphaerota archaeon]|jgi:TusA-related sulfurtransferase|nr:sulfurtransferase TusA family protein [Nitrososphaerota archaeon]MDG7020880.1 sulfurtransferase TusA family protein [Nitrososphaerota archaeon]